MSQLRTNHPSSDKGTSLLFISSIILVLTYVLVLIFNYGFMGIDEYWVAMVKYLPAQATKLSDLVAPDDVKSPSQFIVFFVIAKLALMLGIVSPFYQFKFTIAALTIASILISVKAFRIVASTESLSLGPQTDRKKTLAWFLLIYGLHAIMPTAVSRPMFESLALPWLLMSAAFAIEFSNPSIRPANKRDWPIIASTLSLIVAFCFRPQVGICALVPVFLCLKDKNYRAFFKISALGILSLLLFGIPDIFYHGSYHYSLMTVFTYNIKHGADYGAQPWYYFIPILIVVSFAPFLMKSYAQETWQKIKARKVAIYYIAVFILLHSLFHNKFERFVIPILGILILVIEPFVSEIFAAPKKHWLRISLLLAVNFAIWIPASFSPAQKNMIDMTVYIDQHTEIRKLLVINKAFEWLPNVLALNPGPELIHIDNTDLKNLPLGPHYFGMLESDYRELIQNKTAAWPIENCELLNIFSVNWIEGLAFRFNPEKNQRRQPYSLVKCQK